jgi:polyhydroxybutyrate depolymerase
MQESFSGFTKPDAHGKVKADEVGAIVVTPDPMNGEGLLTWNVSHTPGWTDDEQFVAALIDDVKQDACIDARRVFAMGFAIGGVMASTLACDRPDLVTAIAAVSGLWNPPDCAPQSPTPVLTLHGTDDHFLPYTGGVGDRIGMLNLSSETSAGLIAMAGRPGAPAAAAAWAKRNGCDPPPEPQPVTSGVTKTAWTGCRAAVELYTIDGGSHTWPGSIGMGSYEALLGAPSTAIDANDVIWTFFEKSAR